MSASEIKVEIRQRKKSSSKPARDEAWIDGELIAWLRGEPDLDGGFRWWQIVYGNPKCGGHTDYEAGYLDGETPEQARISHLITSARRLWVNQKALRMETSQ